jgi:hypothetical protein
MRRPPTVRTPSFGTAHAFMRKAARPWLENWTSTKSTTPDSWTRISRPREGTSRSPCSGVRIEKPSSKSAGMRFVRTLRFEPLSVFLDAMVLRPDGPRAGFGLVAHVNPCLHRQSTRPSVSNVHVVVTPFSVRVWWRPSASYVWLTVSFRSGPSTEAGWPGALRTGRHVGVIRFAVGKRRPRTHVPSLHAIVRRSAF